MLYLLYYIVQALRRTSLVVGLVHRFNWYIASLDNTFKHYLGKSSSGNDNVKHTIDDKTIMQPFLHAIKELL